MAKYRVKKHFQLGQLYLEKEQLLLVEPYEDRLNLTVDGTDNTISISLGALDSMIKVGQVTIE